MTPETRVIVLICFSLKVNKLYLCLKTIFTSCQETTSDDVTIPFESTLLSTTAMPVQSTTPPVTLPSSTPTAAPQTTEQQTTPPSPPPPPSQTSFSPSLITPPPTMAPATAPSQLPTVELTTLLQPTTLPTITIVPTTIPATVVPTTVSTTVRPPTAPPVTVVQCNYGNQSTADNQTFPAVCVCPDEFIPIANQTCAQKTDLVPMNLKLERNESAIKVSWTYRMLSSWNISSKITIDKSGNMSMRNTTRTNHIVWSSLPGQMIRIQITPVVNGELIDMSTADILTSFQPAMPGALYIPVRGYNAPNTTIQWIRSRGFVDKYRISMTPLCPVGALGVEYVSNTTSVFVTGLLHGRKYRVEITAISGNISSYPRTFGNFTTVDTVPDAPENVTIIQPIQTTSVRLSIAPVIECQTLEYRYNSSFRTYPDDEFKPYATDTINGNLIDNLIPGTMYKVWIFSRNHNFVSETHFALMFTTAESAPGKVQNVVMNARNTSVSVQFDRPLKPNGELTGYVISISSNRTASCHVQVLSLTTNFTCASVTPFFPQNPQGTLMNCTCTTRIGNGSLAFNIADLQPYTDYRLVLKAYNSVGSGEPVNKDLMTQSGAPHVPLNVSVGDIQNDRVTVSWIYKVLTGPTYFKVEITDHVRQGSQKTNVFCNNVMTTDKDKRSCRVNGLKAFWRYSFVVIAKINTESARSMSSSIITTKQGLPGPVRNLAVYKTIGDDCTEDIYGVKWTEPALDNRNGNITKYRIYSTWSSSARTTPNIYTGYKDTSNEYKVLFEKASSIQKRFDVRVTTINSGYKTSTTSIITMYIPACSPGPSGGMIALVVILVIVCLVAVTALFVVLYRSDMIPCLKNDRPVMLRGISSTPSRHITRERPFVLGNIKQVLDRLKKDSGRLSLLEWKDLNALSPEFPKEVAKLAVNVPKNRYNNILPFDRSRVKLYGGGNDYINANYIPGYKFEREYIACQGPLPGTIVDFWQMVWEQDVPIIVMLTRCKEGETVKCEQYWPENIDEPEVYGMIEVTRTASENNDDYIYSEFSISSGDQEKSVKHFHFLEWPDFSAELECNAFLSFLFKVKNEIHDDLVGPIIVHCSAGVGRTGTYLTVDFLSEYIRTHNLSEEFDIFQHVLKIRQHRTTLVQAREQYLFIHECLNELVKRKKTDDHGSYNGLAMPSEEEYSEHLFDPEDKLMIEEDNYNGEKDSNLNGYDNPNMTTEL
ncbi:tyrosine-protein phosphatase 10D-like isoform X3 [Argopecten irradians]|uniref:tyrosine-protein phosphatase 10D-like isoform X3 n=1 Tax=Argopecten irradians TaxID=31199 RepID=UPI0037208F77